MRSSWVFLGRLGQRQGCAELIDSFTRLCADHPSAVLLVAGDMDVRDGIATTVRARLRDDPRIRWVDIIGTRPRLYARLDVLCCRPTEGFPNVRLKRRPSVACRLGPPVGCVDAVQGWMTGMLVRSRCCRPHGSTVKNTPRTRLARDTESLVEGV